MKQYTYFPVRHNDLEQSYKTQQSRIWTAESISFDRDAEDWKKLKPLEQNFIKLILAFFAMSDTIVVDNLDENFIGEIDIPEAKRFFNLQAVMENIHSETYSLMVQHFMPESESEVIFNDIMSLPSIKKKNDWMMKWFNKDIDLRLRIVAFACIEGIFFSGSFASIFWLSRRGLAKGIVFANREISIDENIHTQFAYKLFRKKGLFNKNDIHLYKFRSGYARVQTDPDFKQQVTKIIDEAYEIEKEFITSIMPESLPLLTRSDMIDHVYFVSRIVLQNLTGDVNKSKTPLDWMKLFNKNVIDAFFESKSSNYNFTLDEGDGFCYDADV